MKHIDEPVLTVADLRRVLADLSGDIPVKLLTEDHWEGKQKEVQLDIVTRDGMVLFY